MINRIYNIVLFISNNELLGNVVPHEFNMALYNAMIEIYEDYFFELNRAITRQNKGLVSNDFSELPNYYREKIKHYLKFSSIFKDGQTYSLPKDLRYLDAVFFKDCEIEPTTNSSQFMLIKKHQDTCVSEQYPIYVLSENKQIHVLPSSIVDELIVWYLRNPKRPNWTFTTLNQPNQPFETYAFNPSASDFQDVDMHVSEEGNLIRKVLLKMGINLKEQQLTNYMLAQENNQFQQENSM